MEQILAILLSSAMKKDSEIPWYLRFIRWSVVAYALLLVAEKAIELFKMFK